MPFRLVGVDEIADTAFTQQHIRRKTVSSSRSWQNSCYYKWYL